MCAEGLWAHFAAFTTSGNRRRSFCGGIIVAGPRNAPQTLPTSLLIVTSSNYTFSCRFVQMSLFLPVSSKNIEVDM